MSSWKKIKINTNINSTGSLSVIEQDESFDFDVKRVFFVSDVEENQIRGEHAHLELKQIIFCTSGHLSLTLDDGYKSETITLEKGKHAVYVDGLVWRTMSDFSAGSTMMVLCDRIYMHDIVIRDYNEFLELVRGK